MKIAITGASGFIGPYIVRQALQQGHQVRCLVRNPAKLVSELGQVSNRVEICEYQLSSAAWQQFAGCDVVIHNAGITKATSAKHFKLANVHGTELAALAALQANVQKFVLISSLAAAAPSFSPIDENVEPQPVSDYGLSKYRAEQAVVHLLKGMMDYTIIRPAAVYGPGDVEFTPLFGIVQRGIKPRFSWDQNPISLVHVADLAGAVLHLSQHASAVNSTYFVAYPEQVTVNQLLDYAAASLSIRTLELPLPDILLQTYVRLVSIYARLSGTPALLSPSKLRELSSPWSCDVTKLRDTGFEPLIDLRTGLKMLLA